jgi:hypothetical protein
VNATGLVLAGSAVAAVELGFADVVAFGEALDVLVGVGVAEGFAAVALAVEVLVWVAVAFAVALALDVVVCVVVGFAVVLEVLVGVAELADGLAVVVVVLGLADVLAVGDFEAVAVGVAVAVLEVLAVGSLVEGDGLGEVLGVAVGVGVGVGVAVDSGNGWHCCTALGAAATAAVSSTAWAAGAASENPEAAARTPPVTTPTTIGCTCAIRMKGPPSALRRFNGTNIRYGVATSSVKCRARAVRPHWTPPTVPSASPPLPTVRERSRRNPDDLSPSVRPGNPALPRIVTLSDACHCLILRVLGIGRAYTRLTRCKLAPRLRDGCSLSNASP